MIRVVVTGSECTGKTTLAGALAERFSTVWVPEYARRFVEEKGAAPEYADVETIARGQMALEDAMAAQASRLLVLDTDLLSTLVYSRHYYGDCPAWVERALRRRFGDLYLLAGTDVPWEPDGNQRDRGTRREEVQDLFRRALESRHLYYAEMRGSRDRRLEQASALIQRLIAERVPS